MAEIRKGMERKKMMIEKKTKVKSIEKDDKRINLFIYLHLRMCSLRVGQLKPLHLSVNVSFSLVSSYLTRLHPFAACERLNG